MVLRKVSIIVFLFLFSFNAFSQLKATDVNSFSINFPVSMPDSAKTAIETATILFSKYIKSDIPINLKIEWKDLGSKVQAACSPVEMFKNFANCPIKDIMYPIALAEKISGMEFNKSWEADILLRINKNMPWYYGLDRKTPSNKIDFYTIILHELFHGIGLQTNYSVQDLTGILFGNTPLLYDNFVFKNNQKLLSIKPNSKFLYDALTSDSLYIDGNFIRIINDNNKAKIYAPKTFNAGSSVSHLDITTYPKGSDNSLLNYTKAYGEAIHTFGNIGKGILAELGWSDFLISTNKIFDIEDVNYSPVILCKIDSIFDPSTLTLHYSFDNFANELSMTFKKTETANVYRANIPAFPFERTVSYKITVEDTLFGIHVGIPSNVTENFYSFKIGIDKEKPLIEHQEIDVLSEDMDSLRIIAKVTDNLGIDTVFVQYLINTSDTSKKKIVGLKKTGKTEFSAYIPLKGLVKENDLFFYKIIAKDNAAIANISTTIGNSIYDYYSIVVSPISLPYPYYKNDFEDTTKSKNDFMLQGFTISKPDKFSNYGLHTLHPYPTAIYSGKTIDLTATLRKPITIRSKEAYLEFDEIVLVEPGEPGTVFGDYEFWDYCIVEGSTNKNEWYPFENKGYKTERFPEWLSTFYSETSTDINGKQSSQAIANESMFKPHKINLLANKYLRKGDNVYIRFRLFSDAFQNGWGWCIDNLNIQTTSVDEELKESEAFTVFPSISKNNSFKIYNSQTSDIVSLDVFTHIGNKVAFSCDDITLETFDLTINAPSGMYFITIKTNKGISIHKVIISK